ncbi:hypothetical protein FBQ97_09230, partial [Acidobacteria bacterium ACD]|nr:hypothetical protein [Acidobacteria bacterium ACD]
MSRRTALVAFLLLTSSAAPAAAQSADSALPGGGLGAFDGKLRLKVELKTNFRSSKDVSFVYVPIGAGGPLEMRTVDIPESPDISPDGRYVAFSALQGAVGDIWLLDLTTGELENLTRDEFAD